METDPKLLEILICPLTKTTLHYDRDKQELVSRAAGLAYPIKGATGFERTVPQPDHGYEQQNEDDGKADRQAAERHGDAREETGADSGDAISVVRRVRAGVGRCVWNAVVLTHGVR